MLITVEAEVEVGGRIRLLEPLEVTRTTKAILTLLEENGTNKNAGSLLAYLESNRLPESSRPTAQEIEAQIEEARDSWD